MGFLEGNSDVLESLVTEMYARGLSNTTSGARQAAMRPGTRSYRRFAPAFVVVALFAVACSNTPGGEAPSGRSLPPLRPGAASPLSHDIVFNRFLPGSEQGKVFRIDAGETTEREIHAAVDAALLSPDGTRFADVAFTAEGRATTAVFDVDGSNYHLLPIPDQSLNIGYGTWSPDSSRIASQGFDDSDPTRVGIYSRNASDGGDLIRLTDAGTRTDYPVTPRGYSPDGSRLLFFRPHDEGETSDSAAQDLFVIGADGRGLRRVNPSGTTSGWVFSGNAATWAPSGTRVAVTLANGPFWTVPSRSVYVVGANGSGAQRVGPRGDIWDAVWSPDGRWIAFTMATMPFGQHELYVMRPDGSGVRALTSDSDGLFAISPKWSPDGSQLLFVRGTDDPHETDIWSVNIDGSQLYQVTHEPAEYIGVAWLP